MDPATFWLAMLAVVGVPALAGLSLLIWPRMWARFYHWRLALGDIEPRAEALRRFRVWGVALLVVSAFALVVFAGIDAAARQHREEVFHGTDAEQAAHALCLEIVDEFRSAMDRDENGLITNVDEIEALAERHGLVAREWKTGPSSNAITIFDRGEFVLILPAASCPAPGLAG